MPRNTSIVYQELDVFSVYVNGAVASVGLVASIGLVVGVGLVMSSNIKEWLKALLANTALMEVASLGISSPKAIR